MNVLDFILAIPMAYLAWKGFRRGLAFEVTSLLGLLLGCWAATHFSEFVANLLGLEGAKAVLVAFFITFIAVVLLSLVLGKCVNNLFKMAKVGYLNHIAGAVVGFIKAVCILGVLLSFVVLADRHEVILKPAAKENSAFFKPVEKTGSWLVSSLETYVSQRRYAKEMEEQES